MKTVTICKPLLLLCLFTFAKTCFAANNDDLIIACTQGDVEAVKKDIDAGADVNYVNAAGSTPLSSAIFQPTIVSYLISKKADPNAGKNLPLQIAATYGCVETMKILLDAGADPNKGTELAVNGIYDKLIAAEEAKPKPNKAILKIYRDLAQKATTAPIYSYPLPTAISFTNSKECIEMLLAKGAKINNTSTGNLFMDYAGSAKTAAERVAKNKEIAVNLEKAGLVVPDWYKNADVDKQASPDEIVKILLKAGADINGTNPRAVPLLFCTQKDGALKANEEVVLALVTNGAKFDMNEASHGFYVTPIIRIASLGYNKVLTYMLDQGADLNANYRVKIDATGEDMQDVTPIMYAAEGGHLETVKLMINRGADCKTLAHGMLIDKVEKCRNKVKSKNLIYYAVESGNLSLVKYLYEEVKEQWGARRLEFEPIVEKQDMGALTMTTVFHGCHNAVLGYDPHKWAEVKGFTEIADYIKSK